MGTSERYWRAADPLNDLACSMNARASAIGSSYSRRSIRPNSPSNQASHFRIGLSSGLPQIRSRSSGALHSIARQLATASNRPT